MTRCITFLVPDLAGLTEGCGAAFELCTYTNIVQDSHRSKCLSRGCCRWEIGRTRKVKSAWACLPFGAHVLRAHVSTAQSRESLAGFGARMLRAFGLRVQSRLRLHTVMVRSDREFP